VPTVALATIVNVTTHDFTTVVVTAVLVEDKEVPDVVVDVAVGGVVDVVEVIGVATLRLRLLNAVLQ
jgi:hypothetical protein